MVPIHPLNLNYWGDMVGKLMEPAQAASILGGLHNGVRIGRDPASQVISSPNWPSADDHFDQVSKIVQDDLGAGILFGPFSDPPFQHYIISPLGAIPKRGSSKIRIIHDLSYPVSHSVNALIDPEEYSLQYSCVDDAVRAIREMEDPFLAKIDLKDAYKAIAIAPEDWHLMGFRWPSRGDPPQFYFSKVLSFGLRSAPAIFDQFASALELFMSHEGVSSPVIRYVDDFLLVAKGLQAADDQLATMISVARRAGFTIQSSKVTAPAKVVEFLGIVIDIDRCELRISEERVVEVKALLAEWRGVKSCSKRKLLKLIGKLAFAARVVRSGRAFLGRLIGLSKKAKAIHHKVSLSASARKDIDWWDKCLASHNATTFMAIDWSAGDIYHVFTDASNVGYGAVWGNEWLAVQYVGKSASFLEKSINWRELHAAVKSLASWAPQFHSRKVLYHIDNAATCFILNKLYTPVGDLMELVRQWCLLVEAHNVIVQVVYISTHDNTIADLLSRDRLEEAKALIPSPSFRVWPSPVQYFDSLV